MKRVTLLAVPILLFSLTASSCPPPNTQQPDDPYAKARFVISIMKITVTTAKTGFDGVAAAVEQGCVVKLCTKLYPDATSQQHQDCLQQDHSASAEYKKCDKITPVKPLVDMGVKIVLQGCDTSTEAVQLAASLAQVREDKKLRSACIKGDKDACAEYQKRVEVICITVDPTKGTEYQNCVQGKPVAKADYTAMLKSTACLAYESFKPIPANPKYDLWINGVRAWLKGYGGCP